MNPMMAVLNQGKVNGLLGQVQQIKQAYNMVRNAGNPQAMMQQVLGNNPQYQQVMQLVQQNGGDAKAAFYSMANQLGINPDDILSALK